MRQTEVKKVTCPGRIYAEHSVINGETSVENHMQIEKLIFLLPRVYVGIYLSVRNLLYLTRIIFISVKEIRIFNISGINTLSVDKIEPPVSAAVIGRRLHAVAVSDRIGRIKAVSFKKIIRRSIIR